MDLLAIKYGQAMETEAVQHSLPHTQKSTKIQNYLNVVFSYAKMPRLLELISPNRIIVNDCCGKSCLDVKIPFSISYTSPTDPNVRLLFFDAE